MIPSGMRSNDDNHELEQVAPGLWAVKNAYKGEYVFGADFPRKEKKMIEGLDSFLQKICFL